jgi:ABC-type transport system involved in cytochrome bd biosynthesis fused ATPase/permease subunit
MISNGLQSFLCMGLAGALLIEHFLRARGVTGVDILLVYWTLKLPSTGGTIASLAHQYPMQRNVMLRLLEPLSAPEHGGASASDAPAAERSALPARRNTPATISVRDGTVVAAGNTILKQVNLSVAAGEHVAIIGRSGAGKSSLLGVLLGWHRLASGSLRIDGVESSEAALASFRRTIAWVDPAVQIWNKSFLENLTYSSEDADFARSAGAIDAANLRRVLQKLPQGLQTHLGEGGGLLSGGEGQRMRLARALAQTDVRLALLDEPFRGLDREQRSALLASTRRHWDGVTLLCATHDVSETLLFDRVLVIEDGMIVEDDEPNRLARTPSRFRDLLEAERLVRDGMWAGRQWRRIHVQDGQVNSADAAPFERLRA